MADPTNAQNAMSYLVGVDFDLLKTNLNAVYSKGENGYKLLVAPTTIDATNSATLDEMLAEFSSAFGITNMDAVTNAMKSIGTIDLTKLSFQLTQAFMYVDKTGTAEAKEYAFGIKVDASQALPDMGFFRIKSLSLAIWNTKRQSVLTRMSMGDFDKLLPA